jgi:hypothetical protein
MTQALQGQLDGCEAGGTDGDGSEGSSVAREPRRARPGGIAVARCVEEDGSWSRSLQSRGRANGLAPPSRDGFLESLLTIPVLLALPSTGIIRS